MVTVEIRKRGSKDILKKKRFRRYEKAWRYVAGLLIKRDETLHYGGNLQYLHVGYSNKKLFPFASQKITRSGFVYKIII